MTILVGHATAQRAQALTVEEIRENMTTREQTLYVSGVVEGIATNRWIAGDEAGFSCIWSWYFGEDQEEAFSQELSLFDQHPDRQVGVLMYALIRQECGE